MASIRGEPDFKLHQTISQKQLKCLLVFCFSNELLDGTESFYVKQFIQQQKAKYQSLLYKGQSQK